MKTIKKRFRPRWGCELFQHRTKIANDTLRFRPRWGCELFPLYPTRLVNFDTVFVPVGGVSCFFMSIDAEGIKLLVFVPVGGVSCFNKKKIRKYH